MQSAQVKNVAKTIMDGIKDAQMQYNYAVDARDAGDAELAKLHSAEASKRLKGLEEWIAFAAGKFTEKGDEPYAEALLDTYRDWMRDLTGKVANFKA